MGIQIVTYKYNLLRVRYSPRRPASLSDVPSHHFFSGLVDRDPSPSPKRFIEHECTARSFPYIHGRPSLYGCPLTSLLQDMHRHEVQ